MLIVCESRAQNGLYILTGTSIYKTAQATEELRRNYAYIKITMLRRDHFSNIYLKIFNNLLSCMNTHTCMHVHNVLFPTLEPLWVLQLVEKSAEKLAIIQAVPLPSFTSKNTADAPYTRPANSRRDKNFQTSLRRYLGYFCCLQLQQ